MKRLLYLLLFFSSIHVKAQFTELKSQQFRNVACACADSMKSLYVVQSDNDTTELFKYDTLSKLWNRVSTLNLGSNPEFLKLSCQVGALGAVFVSGIASPSGGYTVMKYEGGTWSTQLRLLDNDFGQMGSVFMRLYRVNNQVFFTHNADSVFSLPYSNVFRMGTSAPVNLNLKVKAAEYHMAQINDTVLLSANSTIYGYKSNSWSIRIDVSADNAPIVGLAVKNSNVFFSRRFRNYLHRFNYNGSDSILITQRDPELYVKDSFVMLMSRNFLSDRYTVDLIDPAFKVKRGFSFAIPDSLPMKVVHLNEKSYLYYGNSYKFKFGNYNYGNIVEFSLNGFPAPKLDSLYLAPFLDHNKNDQLDPGEQLIAVQLNEINGYQVFQTLAGQMLSHRVYDNEYFCVSGPDKIVLDSCYEARFTGAHCGSHFKSSITNDTILLPYVTDNPDGWRNVKLKMLYSGPQRLDSNRNIQVKVYRSDCDPSTVTGKVYVYIDDNAVVNGSKPNYISKLGNRLEYDFSLAANAEMDIDIKMFYPSAKFSYGQTKVVRAEIFNTTTENQSDNEDSIAHQLMYSFDPNAKYSVPEGRVKYGVSKIKFHIDFQNMGNDMAHRVTIVDTLNLKIPVYEFKIIGASHPYKISHKDNIVTWTFDDINLYPKFFSEELSKGYIEFEAKIKSELRVGDSILNNALIYFDNNEPIYTNASRLSRVTGLNSITVDDLLSIYPNPVSDQLTIKNKKEEAFEISIMDATGRCIGAYSIDADEVLQIDVSDWCSGVYMVSIKGYGAMMIIKG